MKPLKPMPESGKATPPATAATERQAFVEVVELIQTAGQRTFFAANNGPKLSLLLRELLWTPNLLILVKVFLLGLVLLSAVCSYAQVGDGLEGSVVALAIDPQTSTTLYAGTGGGVYKSADSGRQWTAMNTGLADRNVEAIAIDPHTPTTLYVGTYGGVFKSMDGGGSWTPINTGLPANTHPYTLVIDPLTPTTLYMGSGDGVFKSSDGGKHWEAINSGLTDGKTTTLVITSTTPTILYAGMLDHGMFQSTTGGKNWVATNTGLTDLQIRALAIVLQSPQTLYAGAGGGIFTSTDGGKHWTACNVGFPTTRCAPPLSGCPLALCAKGAGGGATVRTVTVLSGCMTKSWIPAFAGMTGKHDPLLQWGLRRVGKRTSLLTNHLLAVLTIEA